MARLNLTRSRTLGIGLAVVSLAFAACSKNSSSPLPVGTPTPIVSAAPTPTGSPNSLSSPCASSLGIAYEPDGGGGGSFNGVQVTHFEDGSSNLCAATAAPDVAPPAVAFASSVGALAFATDRSDAVAILKNSAGAYTLAQDIFGASIGAIVPVGPTYDLSANPPTPAPTGSGTPAPASPVPLLADAASVALLGTSNGAVALAAGTTAAGSVDAITALTSLTNAPPQYGQAVPYVGSTYTLKNVSAGSRQIVRVGTDASNAIVLARGTQDLLAFQIVFTGSSYQFDLKAQDTTLGSNTPLRGNGEIAFDPSDATRALVGGTTAGGGTTLTLVTGLPLKITHSSTLTLPATIRSIAIASNGLTAVVGTDAGIVAVNGVASGTLAIVAPFAPNAGSTTASAPSYRTCTGANATLSAIDSIAISGDQRYLVALGTTPGVTCASGYNASIVAVPFNTGTGTAPTPAPSTSPSATATATPGPASFVQNNLIAPPVGADYFFAF